MKALMAHIYGTNHHVKSKRKRRRQGIGQEGEEVYDTIVESTVKKKNRPWL